MDVTLKDGRIVEFPDGTDQKVVDAYVSRYFPEKPNVVERTIGHLSKGAGTALGMIENLGSYVENVPNVLQGRPLSPVGEASPERYALENNPFAAQVAEHPETSMIGQLLGGAAEFIPQIPLYALGEGLALRGAAAIPKVGQYVAPLLTKGAGPLANYGKAIARAGIAGAVVGGAISSPIQTGVGEHLKEGAIGAAEFAGATAVLHPAFAGLGKVGRSIYRRMGKKATPEKVEAELERRAETDSQAAEELQRLREQRIEPAEGKTETEELYVPQGEKVPRGKEQGELFVEMPSEEVMAKLRERGYTDEKVKEILTTDPEGKELVSALEKEVPVDVKALEGETAQAEKVLESPRQRRKRLIEKAKAAKAETAEAPSVQNLNIEDENVTLYHATPKNIADTIRKEGFKGASGYDLIDTAMSLINAPKKNRQQYLDSLYHEYYGSGAGGELSDKRGPFFTSSKTRVEEEIIGEKTKAEGILNALHNIWIVEKDRNPKLAKAAKEMEHEIEESPAEIIELTLPRREVADYKNGKGDIVLDEKIANKYLGLSKEQEAAVEKALLTAEEIDARAKAWVAEHGGRKRKVLTPGEKAVEEDATLADTIAGEGSTVFDRKLGKIDKKGFEEAIAEADRNLVESEKLLDRLADKTEKAPTDEDLVDLADDLYQTEDPVAQALVESIPKDRESLIAHVRSQMEKIIAEKKAAREAVDATKKGKERRKRGKKEVEEPKPVEVKKEALAELKDEWEKLLEDEGMPEELGREELPTESLDSSFQREGSLDFSDRGMSFYDNIEDGVYLDSLGFQQIYNKLAPYAIKSAQALGHLGKFIYMEGYKSFEAFSSKLKEVLGESWQAVRRYAREAYRAAKEWNDRLGEGGWIRVGQGGGAKYDRVEDKYIGSGEGGGRTAEKYTGAYGWGHYFSSSKGVYENYAKTIGSKAKTNYKHQLDTKLHRWLVDNPPDIDVRRNMELLVHDLRNGVDKEVALDSLEYNLADLLDSGAITKAEYTSARKVGIEIANIEVPKTKHVHEFDLPDELNLLDWDKSVPDKQLKSIADALEKHDIPPKVDEYGRVGAYGSQGIVDLLRQDISTKQLEPGMRLVDDLQGPFTGDILAKVGDVLTEDLINTIKKEGIEWLDTDKGFAVVEKWHGSGVYDALQKLFGGKGASKFLSDEAGIHGNTFIGHESGKRNYVIFDEKHVPPPVNHYTLDMLGGQQMYNWAKKLVASRKTQQNAPSNGIIAEVNGKRLTAKDDADFVEGSMKSLATNLGKMARAKLITPDVAFENNPRVGPLQFDLHKRFLESIHAASKRNESIRAAETMLRDVSDKEALKNILEGREIPKSEKLRDAALIVRKELDAVREKYKEYLRGQMLENLNKHEFAVISQVLAGKDIAEAIAQYTPKDALGRRMKSPIDRAVIEDILADYKKIDNWGFDNYFTHYERGPLRIVSGGKLYAKAMSVEDAARKFIDLNQMYPELDFKLDTSHMQGELATGISSRSYGLIMNDMQKGLKETIEGINSAVQKRLAQKVLEGRFFIKPTKEFSPYALERRAKLQGEKNPFDVLYHYMYSMEKKIGLDPRIDAIRRAMAKKVVVGKESYTYVNKKGIEKTGIRDIKQSYLTDDESKFLEKYTNDVKGRIYREDEFIDGILKGFVAPRAYSRFVARSREIEANLKFAYRPVAGFINGLSGIGHVWTKTGLKHTTDAVEFLRTTEGKAFIKDMEPYLGINVVESATGELTTRGTFERLRLLPTPKTKVGEFGHKAIEPMAFFQAPEIPVRKLTMAANYLMSKSEGMSEAAARDSAIKATWFQQFSYDIASLPEFMRGPTGRLITQFKPYLVKEIEFISHLRGPEIARYAGMQLAIGGPRGLIMLAKSLPILGAFYGWSELENYLNKEWPRASRGIGGALGVDISAPATFQFPQAMRDWIGPTLSDLVNLYNNVIDPTVQNIVNFMSPDTPDVEIGKTFKSAIPIFKHYANLWDQVVGSKDGWVKDEQGRPLWNIDNMGTFTAKSLAGAESLEVNRIRVYERNLREKTERIADAKGRTTQNILEAISKGEAIEQEDLNEMIRLGIKPSTLRRAAKYRALDPKMRRLLMTEIIRRPEILQEYPDAGDLER